MSRLGVGLLSGTARAAAGGLFLGGRFPCVMWRLWFGPLTLSWIWALEDLRGFPLGWASLPFPFHFAFNLSSVNGAFGTTRGLRSFCIPLSASWSPSLACCLMISPPLSHRQQPQESSFRFWSSLFEWPG